MLPVSHLLYIYYFILFFLFLIIIRSCIWSWIVNASAYQMWIAVCIYFWILKSEFKFQREKKKKHEFSYLDVSYVLCTQYTGICILSLINTIHTPVYPNHLCIWTKIVMHHSFNFNFLICYNNGMHEHDRYSELGT